MKQERQQKHVAQLNQERQAKKAAVAGLKKDWADRARKYHDEYSQQIRELVRVKREAKAKGEYYVEGQPKVILATRIRG